MEDPTMHPKEREYLDTARTLVVTVQRSHEFGADVSTALDELEDGSNDVDGQPTLSFTSHEHLLRTFTPRTLELLETIHREEPASINETARIVDRDVKNVHDELTRLAQLGVIYFENSGQAMRPVVWFDELTITLDMEPDDTDVGVPA